MEHWPRAIAHRGASARAPENTLVAFRLALDADRCDGLELDVQRTRDGAVVVLHDETLDRTTNGTGPAAQHTLAALRDLDAGFRFQPPAGAPPPHDSETPPDGSGASEADARYPWRGRGVTVPTLQEVLEAFPSAFVSIDLKRGDPLTERETVAIVRALHAQDRVVVGAEHEPAAARLRALAPELPAFFSRTAVRDFYVRHRLRWWRSYRPPALSLQIPVRAGPLRLAHRRLVADAHRLGLRVSYWTVNEVSAMEHLLDLGADALITDRPDRLRQVLLRRGDGRAALPG